MDRARLLQAAARLDSSSSASDSGSESDHRSSRRKADHKQHSSKKRKNKQSSKKSHKAHKRHRRSDHEKIAELEKRAAAMGAAAVLPSMGRLGFGRYSSTASAGSSGDSVILDTSGDANNALYESLYSGDVPRYNRMDPLDLVRVSRRLGVQLTGDTNLGNAAADRYYRGRHYLQERSRTAKRINLADLQHKASSSTAAKLRSGTSTVFLPLSTPLLPSAKPGAAAPGHSTGLHAAAAAVQLQEQQAGSSRKLAIPAPAFIPLEAPEELLQQQQEGTHAGSWRQQHGLEGTQQKSIDPIELVEQAGLTPDELLLQATRAWNIAVRERPQDEHLWLDFAAFQHSAAQHQQQRGSHRGATTGLLDPVTAEKQISLVSKGLTYHPSSSQLLLALLRCYAAVAPDVDALEAKWASVLARQGGSWELWREYIALRQSSFADFKVSGVQKVYQDALHSLHVELLAHRRKAASAHKQQHKEVPELTPQQLQQLTPLAAAAAAASAAGSSGSTGLGLAVTLGEQALELQLVQLLLGLLYVELEAGYCEQALAKIQALLEFHLFPPPLPPGGVPALQRLFAAYWSSGVPHIGEAGARGWAYWCLWHAMGMEQPNAAPPADDEPAQEEKQQEPAGWSGWFEVPQAAQQQDTAALDAAASPGQHSAQQASNKQKARAGGEQQGPVEGSEPGQGQAGDTAAAAGSDSEQVGSEQVDSEQVGSEQQQEEQEEEEEFDEEELMRQLGLQLEQQLQEVERQGLPADVLARWVQEEASCCASQWQPLRTDGTAPGSTAAQTTGPDADAAADVSPPDPARIAGLDSVEPCLFLLRSAAALRRLVLGCVELLGVPLGLQVVPWCSSNSPTPWQQQALSTTGAGVLGSSSSSRSTRVSCWSDAAADGVAHSDVPQQRQQQQHQWQQCQQVPWYAASDERWQWAVNLLQRLVAGGPCSDWHELCQALLVLQASKPSEAAAAGAAAAAAAAAAPAAEEAEGVCSSLQQLTLDGAAAAVAAGGSSSSTWPSQQQLSAARAAAKQLLSDQQDNLLLYDAYGCLEAAAGQVKTARKVFETALALATAAAAGGGTSKSTGAQDTVSAAAAAPLLALHLAQLEFTAGGKASCSKAHVALHALLAGQQLQVAAAAEAAAASTSKQQQQPQHAQPGAVGLLADAQLREARVKFQQHIPTLITTAGGALTPAAASTIAGAALFELVVGLRKGDAAAGLDAAAAVCKQVTAAVPETVRATSAQHEQLAILQCHMLVAAATGYSKALAPGLTYHSGGPASSSSSGKGGASSGTDQMLPAALAAAVPPARAREALAAALLLYPHSKPLLQLQVALDHACYTLSGLRRQLATLLEVNPSPGLWAVALQAEALRPGGRVRIGVLFERALAAPTALNWHQQERLQRQRRKQAWAAACAGIVPPPRQQGGQQVQTAAEQQQALLMQAVTAEGCAAALLDLSVWDGYRGWGHCAGLWQQYIQYELGLGRLDAARKLFLRAVHAVPGAKGLWLSGFGGVCAGLQARECSGLLNVMQEREVVVRTDVYEVLLAAMAEKQQMQLG